VPAGANLTVAFAQFGRIFAALGAGRHFDAYEAAERLLDPASPAHHPIIACGLIGELAEAALHTGRINEARARVKQVEAASGDIPGTSIAVGLLHARALSRGTLRKPRAAPARRSAPTSRTGRFSVPGYCWPTANGYGASAGSPNRARRCGTPATPSTPWAARPGATKPAESSGPPASPAAGATSPP
jgi:hypothetical protein